MTALAALAPVAAPAGDFGPEVRVNTTVAGDQGGPMLAGNAAGDAVAVWQEQTDDASGTVTLALKGRRFASGQPSGDEFRLDGAGIGGPFAVAMNAVGAFVAVHFDVPTETPVFRLYDRDGLAVRPAQPLGLLPDERLAWGKAAGMDALGNFVVVSDGATEFGTVDIRARLFGGDGEARTAAPFVPVVTGLHGGWQHNGTVGVGPNGHFVVAWNDTRTLGSGYDTQIYARAFAGDGTALTEPFEVSTTRDGNVDPAVAVDHAGNFVVVWTHKQDHVRARAFAAGGAARGPDFQVSQGGQAALPDVGMDAAGASVVTWYNVVDVWREDVFVRRYAPGGAPIDAAPVRVNLGGNSDGRGVQLYPKIAVDGRGDFLVAWEDTAAGSDDGGSDIRARHHGSGTGSDAGTGESEGTSVATAAPSAAGTAGGSCGSLLLLALALAGRTRRR